ncbi:unnamed protein product [Moneuplotes crassus]|uniref:F-box domain-containing protein n=1 Tax=Euplotes crassus TaxID=5936 RepID=A0AAD1Y237_EUPCR|nr:unnamed protein product [Moneuplotes crassus]
MSIPNKFSSHLPSPTSKKDPTIEVKEDNTLREAENMLASPLRQDQPIASPKEEEIERMINSQSLSVVFQDLNDEQLAKFNKKSLDAIAEAQWAENRGALSSDRHQNFDVPLNERKEGLQNKSMASQLTEEKKREHMKTDGNIRAQANTPHKKPSISNKLDLKLKAPMSKNNSPIYHSDRSHLKLANEGNGQQRDSLNKSQVKKDKLFSEEDPYVNSKEYQIGDGVDNSKNDWSYNATKPGIDRSEFYNPNNDDLPHNQSILNQNNAGKIIKQPLALRNTGDRFQNEIDNRETGYGETHNFQTKHADHEIRELEDLKQTKFELPRNNSDKKLYSYNHPNNFKSNQAREYKEPTYEDVYNSNEDIDHEEGTPHKSQVVQNTATKRHDSVTKSIGRSSEEIKKGEGMKSSGSRKNLFKGGQSCDSFATSNDDKSQSLQKMSRNSATNVKSLLKSKKNILNDLPFNCMQMVCYHLNINSMCKLACTNKKMLEKVKEQSDIWNIKTSS